MQGRIDESIEALGRFAALTKDSALAMGCLGFVHASAGDESAAREVLARMLEASQTRYINPVSIVILRAALEEFDQVEKLSRQALEERDPLLLVFRTEPLLDPFRNTAWFQSIEREVGIWD
jgi:hypothetical protein